ncbi:MAG: DUF2914 domain-containing protein [Balneolaceae bacterium]|nr:DUF2914 domain-containing protein [Balneolaceae bacterium]
MWRDYSPTFYWQEGDSVFVYTSIFAPADLKKSVYHRWRWFSPHTRDWEVTDEISYEIIGGREGGYRGYTFKKQMMAGDWNVEVVTEEGLVLGSINFVVSEDSTQDAQNLVQETF